MLGRRNRGVYRLRILCRLWFAFLGVRIRAGLGGVIINLLLRRAGLGWGRFSVRAALRPRLAAARGNGGVGPIRFVGDLFLYLFITQVGVRFRALHLATPIARWLSEGLRHARRASIETVGAFRFGTARGDSIRDTRRALRTGQRETFWTGCGTTALGARGGTRRRREARWTPRAFTQTKSTTNINFFSV